MLWLLSKRLVNYSYREIENSSLHSPLPNEKVLTEMEKF